MREDFLFPRIELPAPLADDDLEDLTPVIPLALIRPYIDEEMIRIRSDKLWQFGYQNFKDEQGNPWEMSPGELAIFRSIVLREHTRIEVVTSTQYGKTITISRALLTRITTYADDFLVVVPDLKRGQIMLNYMIRDTANNDYFKEKLVGQQLGKRDALNRLLEERSKVKLTYRILDEDEADDAPPKYGSVEVLTADARRKENAITTIMGFGGRNVINDESALIDDDIEAGIFRMLAGKGADTFYVKIGNPFFRNHFLLSWKDRRYKKIFVNKHIALAEGRYTQEFLDEASSKPQADILYDCKFPSESAIDRKGWMNLLTTEEIRMAMEPALHFGEDRLGVDPADEGINLSVIVRRSHGYAEIVYANETIDPMAFVGQVVLTAGELTSANINWSRKIYYDKVGVGSGQVSRLREVNKAELEDKLKITGVNAGDPSRDPAKFFNKRAEMYWATREWIKAGGRLSKDERWYQLATIKYTTTSKGQIQIKPKKDMKKEDGVESPDVADSLSMTFYDPASSLKMTEEDKFFARKMRDKKLKERRMRRMIG